MDFGIALPTAADSWRVVKQVEEAGFTHAWFYDTQMLSADCFVAMGAAAVNTRRIRLGTGVLVPSNRIAPVAANALATLNQLAPGRIDFGVGKRRQFRKWCQQRRRGGHRQQHRCRPERRRYHGDRRGRRAASG